MLIFRALDSTAKWKYGPLPLVQDFRLEGNNACFQLPDDANRHDGRVGPSVEEGADRA